MDEPKIEIRPAKGVDARAVSEILLEAAGWLYECGRPLWRPEQLTVDAVAPDCRAGFFHLAWNSPSTVGTVRLTEIDPLFWPEADDGEAIYVHRLAVRREAAGGRVSTELLAHAVAMAIERGMCRVRLDCESNRPRLREVYERFGFEFHSDAVVRGVHVARYEFDCARHGRTAMTIRLGKAGQVR